MNIKPAEISKVIPLFFFTSAFICLGLYWVLPNLVSIEIPFFYGYIITFYPTFVLMFFLAFLLYKNEGNGLNIQEIKIRFRLEKLNRKDMIYVFCLFIASFATYFLLSFSSKALAQIALFAPPEYFPPEINPLKDKTDFLLFMGFPMLNNWLMIILYFFGWFFNIFGEEFLWRGYLLPKMELKWGKAAWVINGSLWAIWHIFWKWNLIVIMPSAFLIPLIAQKTKKTWIGIIVHGTMNAIPLIYLVLGVMGIIK